MAQQVASFKATADRTMEGITTAGLLFSLQPPISLCWHTTTQSVHTQHTWQRMLAGSSHQGYEKCHNTTLGSDRGQGPGVRVVNQGVGVRVRGLSTVYREQ